MLTASGQLGWRDLENPQSFAIIDLDLSPGERVVGASLSIGLRRTGAGESGDEGVELAGMPRGWSLKELGWEDLGTMPDARVIDLNGVLDGLHDHHRHRLRPCPDRGLHHFRGAGADLRRRAR